MADGQLHGTIDPQLYEQFAAWFQKIRGDLIAGRYPRGWGLPELPVYLAEPPPNNEKILNHYAFKSFLRERNISSKDVKIIPPSPSEVGAAFAERIREGITGDGTLLFQGNEDMQGYLESIGFELVKTDRVGALPPERQYYQAKTPETPVEGLTPEQELSNRIALGLEPSVDLLTQLNFEREQQLREEEKTRLERETALSRERALGMARAERVPSIEAWNLKKADQEARRQEFEDMRESILEELGNTPFYNWLNIHEWKNKPNPYSAKPERPEDRLAAIRATSERLDAAAQNILKRLSDPDDPLTRSAIINPRTPEEQTASEIIRQYEYVSPNQYEFEEARNLKKADEEARKWDYVSPNQFERQAIDAERPSSLIFERPAVSEPQFLSTMADQPQTFEQQVAVGTLKARKSMGERLAQAEEDMKIIGSGGAGKLGILSRSEEVKPKSPTTPLTPQWLKDIYPSLGDRVTKLQEVGPVSLQTFERLPETQKQALMGYWAYSGGVPADILSEMDVMRTRTPSVPRITTPFRQKGSI